MMLLPSKLFSGNKQLIYLALLALLCCSTVYGIRLKANKAEEGDDDGEDELQQVVVLLFMFFGLGVGIVVMQLLSFFGDALPYTCVVFLLGVVFAAADNSNGPFGESVNNWVNINADLLLFTFLPPLIFGEAMSLNWYHVKGGFLQSVILAGPGVLIGAALMGVITKFLLPYNWNWSLAMTFGSILSATDPVAVVALLKQVGASPKLTILIVGESLLNDGSAMVLFTIFYNTLNGTTYTVSSIIEFMFSAAIGSVLLGMAFGLVAVRWLRTANRPLKEIDVLTQIAITLCCAYLCFFTAQYVFEISGVLACCGAGAMLAWLAPPIILNHESMHNVWGMIEWALNTLIFLLAGLIIGHRVLGKVHPIDWAYMVMLYLILMGVRLVTIGVLFPFISKIGHRCSLNEALFMSWAGLRGALGMALALLVKNNCPQHLEDETSRLFFYVGGIAALTLVINAPTSQSLLYKLGLLGADSAEKMIVTDQIKKKLRRKMDKVIVHMAKEFAFTEEDLEEVRMSCTLLNDINMDTLYRDTERMSTLLADAVTHSTYAPQYGAQAIPATANTNARRPSGSSFIVTSHTDALSQHLASHHVTPVAQQDSSDDDEVVTGKTMGDDDDDTPAVRPLQHSGSGDFRDMASNVEAVRRGSTSSVAFDEARIVAGRRGSANSVAIEEARYGATRRGSSSSIAHRTQSSSFSGTRQRMHSESAHKLHETMRVTQMSRLLSVSARGNSPMVIKELLEYIRAIFLEIVRVKYWHYIEVGKLPRQSFSAQFLLYTIEVALDEAKEEHGARDWNCVEEELNYNPYVIQILSFLDEYLPFSFCTQFTSKQLGKIEARNEKRSVYMLTSFIEAHEHAQKKIHAYLGLEDEEVDQPTPEELQVIEESRGAVEKARRMLSSMSVETITAIRSKQAARLVLSKEAEMVKSMVEEGLLTPAHAEEFLEEISADTERIEKERNRMYKKQANMKGRLRRDEKMEEYGDRASIFSWFEQRPSMTVTQPLVGETEEEE